MRKCLSIVCLFVVLILSSSLFVSADEAKKYITPASNPWICSTESPGKHVRKLWEIEGIRETVSPGCFDSVFYASENELFFITDTNKLAILDIETGKIKNTWSNFKYLSVFYKVDDALLVMIEKSSSENTIVALDYNTKKKIWEYSFTINPESFSESSFFYNHIVSSGDYSIFYENRETKVCFETKTGKVLWKIVDNNDIELGAGFLVDDKFYHVIDRRRPKPKFSCFDILEKKTIWTIDEPRCLKNKDKVEPGEKQNFSIRGIEFREDFYYVLIDNFESTYYVICLDSKNGSKKWEFETKTLISYIEQIPYHNKILVYDYDGTIFMCLDKDTGTQLWQKEITSGADSFLPTEKYIYAFNSSEFYTIDVDTGERHISIEEFTWPSGFEMAIIDRRLFLFSNDKPSITCYDGYTEINYRVDRKSYYIGESRTSMDSSPIIQNDRTLLPARYVLDPLDGEITWDGDERKVICKLLTPREFTDDLSHVTTVELWIDNPVARVNGMETQIDETNPDVTPTIVDGRTMVPMRFLAESLGCKIEWIADKKEINLSYLP